MTLEARTPPPLGPWEALGVGMCCLAFALFLIWTIRRVYRRDPRSWERTGPEPHWWRIHVLGMYDLTLVPLVFMTLGSAVMMVWFALFLWTDIDVFGVLGVFTAAAALGCFPWCLFDSYRPLRWREDRDDQYSVYR